jgi:hypothetical protein
VERINDPLTSGDATRRHLESTTTTPQTTTRTTTQRIRQAQATTLSDELGFLNRIGVDSLKDLFLAVKRLDFVKKLFAND